MMRIGQERLRGVAAMAGLANDRADQHRQGDGRHGSRACERFTSALDGRSAPGQAQTASAGPAGLPTTTVSSCPHRRRRHSTCVLTAPAALGPTHSRIGNGPPARMVTGIAAIREKRPGSGLSAGPGDPSGLRASTTCWAICGLPLGVTGLHTGPDRSRRSHGWCPADGCADGGHLLLPMGADHQHRLGPLRGRSEFGQRRSGGTGLQGKHRWAVGHEQHRGRGDHAAPGT
jgi:hypothetical protein